MSKLHELLAVESDLDNIQKTIVAEAQNTFTKKPHMFFGFEKRLDNYNENLPEAPRERQELTTTVTDKLEYVNAHIIRYFDAVLQKELTNQTAKADIIIGETVLAKDVPTTFLLGLETKLKTIRALYESIPTLPSGIGWDKDTELGEDIYRARNSEKKYRTAKTFKHKVLYEATDHHPAQIERWEENENVGMYITDKWTGLISPAQKSDYLGRLDLLIRAVKKARQRGNNTQVVKTKIARDLFSYVMEGL
jgi:hypothetical protein